MEDEERNTNCGLNDDLATSNDFISPVSCLIHNETDCVYVVVKVFVFIYFYLFILFFFLLRLTYAIFSFRTKLCWTTNHEPWATSRELYAIACVWMKFSNCNYFDDSEYIYIQMILFCFTFPFNSKRMQNQIEIELTMRWDSFQHRAKKKKKTL